MQNKSTPSSVRPRNRTSSQMIAATYRKLLQIGKVSGAVSFLAAAPYALVQYWQARDAARVEQTLSFYKLYNAKPFTDYREKMTKALVKHKIPFKEAASDEILLSEAQSNLIKTEDAEMELLLLFDFFDGVSVCITAKVCDDDTALKLFKPRARDLYINFYQYMMVQRGNTTTSDFGAGLQLIARSGSPVAAARP
jgi:hypothetical protein